MVILISETQKENTYFLSKAEFGFVFKDMEVEWGILVEGSGGGGRKTSEGSRECI